jgi:TatD DNase family protein
LSPVGESDATASSIAGLIDTHCHLDVPEFDEDREQVLATALSEGVDRIVLPGVDQAGWPRIRAACAADSRLLPCYGIHPMLAGEHGSGDVPKLRQMVQQSRPVAIGEIGLDYYEADALRATQRAMFMTQLRLASEFELPVILHVRKAHDEVIKLLREFPPLGGIVHAFNGSLEQAKRYADLGFAVGLGGMVTRERSTKLRRLAGELPSELIVLETDAPDLSPATHHGERNSPAYLPEILHAIASLRNCPPEVLAAETTANAERVLRLNQQAQQ